MSATGHTYYVATNGSDSHSGSSGSPFKTIQKCATKVVAGDTCQIAGGDYHETVTPARGGTANARITAPGARVTENNWFVSDSATVTSSTVGSVTAPDRAPCVGLSPNQRTNYTLSGKLALIGRPGEWFYQASTHKLYLWSPDGTSPASHVVEAEQRNVGIDLSGKSCISVVGLGLKATTAVTSSTSKENVLDQVTARYVSAYNDFEQDPNTVTTPDGCAVPTAGETTSGNRIYNNTSGTETNVASTFGGTYTDTEIVNNIGVTGNDPGITNSNNLTPVSSAQYTNPAVYDFTLKSTSPARNAGVVKSPATDGFTDPTPSPGAYQYGVPKWSAGAVRTSGPLVEAESYTSSNGVSPSWVFSAGSPQRDAGGYTTLKAWRPPARPLSGTNVIPSRVTGRRWTRGSPVRRTPTRSSSATPCTLANGSSCSTVGRRRPFSSRDRVLAVNPVSAANSARVEPRDRRSARSRGPKSSGTVSWWSPMAASCRSATGFAIGSVRGKDCAPNDDPEEEPAWQTRSTTCALDSTPRWTNTAPPCTTAWTGWTRKRPGGRSCRRGRRCWAWSST